MASTEVAAAGADEGAAAGATEDVEESVGDSGVVDDAAVVEDVEEVSTGYSARSFSRNSTVIACAHMVSGPVISVEARKLLEVAGLRPGTLVEEPDGKLLMQPTKL